MKPDMKIDQTNKFEIILTVLEIPECYKSLASSLE